MINKRKLLQVNSVVNTGSTGRIAEEIGRMAMQRGWDSIIAYGRHGNKSESRIIKIGSKLSNYIHVIQTRLLDKHGLCSTNATNEFIKNIKRIQPELIHLHNIHGYYINYELLFTYLAQLDVPVVWTLHDCWAFTGHCSHYEYIPCDRWQTYCHSCPQPYSYPKSYVDNSYQNYIRKKAAFREVRNLTLVPVSQWLEKQIKESFLRDFPVTQIYNGIDLDNFRPFNTTDIRLKYGISESKTIYLGVANTWTDRKGLGDFQKLTEKLTSDEVVVLVGLTSKQLKSLPNKIIGIQATENIEDLAALYNAAKIFINPTWEDNFPTTNIEALACGTPVITYETGGSPEAIDKKTGRVVAKGDISAIRKAMDELNEKDSKIMQDNCRSRAERYFDKKDKFQEYIDLYETLVSPFKKQR